jgi:hypothetical protein
MNSLQNLMGTYSVDLSLRPTTFDLWHVCLAGTVLVLMGLLLLSLLALLMTKGRNVSPTIVENIKPIQQVEPTVKIIETIIEVEKIVPAAAPEQIILKEYTSDAALQVLGLLQKEARFIDFIKEDIASYNDAEIGAAARVVHNGCNKTINEYFKLTPVRSEAEGSLVTIPADFDAATIRLTGNIVGAAPFSGTLVHKGWQVQDVRLPKLTEGHNPTIVAAAEVEL